MRPQRNCHKPHGTIARYTAGCSCLHCCDAWRDYQTERRAAGAFTVDGSEARTIIASLRRRGYSRRAISDGSAVAYRTLRAIESGESTRVRTATLEALRAFQTPPSGSTALVPARRTKTLLRRLRMTMTEQGIADALGISRSSLPSPDQRCVQFRTEEAIEELAFRAGVAQREVDPERFAQLVDEGHTSAEIAAALGCSTRTVFRHLAHTTITEVSHVQVHTA